MAEQLENAAILRARGPRGGADRLSPASYEAVVARATERALSHAAALASARAQAEREIVDLLRRSTQVVTPREARTSSETMPGASGASGAGSIPASESGLHLWARCEALLEASWALRNTDPSGMVILAALALACAEKIRPQDCGGPAHVADLRARAWAELGNAHRVADDKIRADAPLAHALEAAGEGTGNPLLLARIMDLTSSLLRDRNSFAEAARLLDWTFAIYSAHGEHHLAGRALISKGMVIGHDGDCERAIRLVAAGLDSIDCAADPGLVFSAVHALIDLNVRLGRFLEGERLLRLSRRLYAQCANAFNLLRLRWVEGKIAAGLGDIARAEADLLAVREQFGANRMPHTVAMVSLDLAELWLGQGRTEEAQELVEEILATFRALRIRREAISALLTLRRALANRRATVELVRSVSARLRRLEALTARRS
jgi:tetratricopeptide (TPR) repeat protein